jgi:phosphoribosylanthranilate isomerase
MQIKICGIIALDDALAAADAGADLLGFNFYPPSPRYIEPQACARLVAALRSRGIGITTVGVFVNAPPAEVAAILDACGLDLAQLHGDEPPEALTDLGGRAFKAIRPATPAEGEALAAAYARRVPPALLVDACHPGLFGGSGQAADWGLAAALAATHPILLAGGLRPDNVAAAIARVQPWGVDVASGVETSPGRKEPTKMVEFMRATRGEWANQRMGESANERISE